MSPTTPVLVVMGVSGCGKSTLAARLARDLGWDRLEGDELHPAANVAKMASGRPLTDGDRWPWLAAVDAWIGEHADAGRPGVVTCSALRRRYRDRLRRPGVVFVHLAGDRDRIGARMAARSGHFMPTSLLDSQFATLEIPDADENVIALAVELPTDEQVRLVVQRLTNTDTIRTESPESQQAPTFC